MDVPTCPGGCARRLRLHRILELTANIVLGGVGVWLGRELLGDWEHVVKPWALLGCGILGALPAIVWSTLRPASFDLTPYSDEVVYAFADESYAAAFIERNPLAKAD